MTNDILLNKYSSSMPDYIDIKKLPPQGYHWQGDFELAKFPRLVDVLVQKAETTTDFKFSVVENARVYFFSFSLQASMQTQCQRCLKLMDIDLNKSFKLAVLEDKAHVNLINEDDEWVLLEEVSLSEKNELKLLLIDMIEDELLLSLPLAPKHDLNAEGCVPVAIIDEEEVVEVIEKQANPFAVLAELKQQ